MWRNAFWMKRCGCAGFCRANLRRARATDAIMPGPFPASLQQKIEDRLRFYDDLGITLFYRDRARVSVAGNAVGLDTALLMEEIVTEEMELPKSAPKDIATAKSA